MKSVFAAILCVFLVSACGGGGGGGSGDSSKSSSSAAATPVANAGADITVDMGETVNLNPSVVIANPENFNIGGGDLEITGSSTRNSDIVKLEWTLIEGAPLQVTANDTTSGRLSFVAPSTEGESSVRIVYRLTLTNAAGNSATDTITITINRVNQAPIAVAGNDLEVIGESEVSISGAGSSDADGSISSYAWAQVSGDTIDISDTESAVITFTAPDVTQTTEYEFQLTVTDADGSTATDTVVLRVTPKDAPELNVYFPPAVGVYEGETISVFGDAAAVDATLAKVEVSVGGEFLEAIIDDGKWRVDSISLPQTDMVTITIRATDSESRITEKTSELFTEETDIGTGQLWDEVVTLGINHEKSQVLVFASGNLLNELRVFPIDLKSGNRGADISNFGQASQGVNSSALIGARYDASSNTFFMTTSPIDESVPKQIIAINAESGQRRVVSDETTGTGVALDVPAGVVADGQGNLYVADNGTGKVIRVDIETGNRIEIANVDTEDYSLEFVIDVVMDSGDSESLYALPNLLSSAVLGLNLAVSPVTSSIVTNSGNSAQGGSIMSAKKMEIDTSLNKLFLTNTFGTLYEVDITSGARTQVGDFDIESMGYDHARHLLYFSKDIGDTGIWVYDPVSKQAVMMSGSF